MGVASQRVGQLKRRIGVPAEYVIQSQPRPLQQGYGFFAHDLHSCSGSSSL
jgi:hypothetical protein